MEKKMEKVILGIDPGANGALAFYDGVELLIYEMPTHTITKGKSQRKRFDPYGMKAILSSNACDSALIEQVSAQPGNGAASAFTYGWMCGGLETALAMAGIPFDYVTPQCWKKALACPKDKDGARMRASQLLPEFSHKCIYQSDIDPQNEGIEKRDFLFFGGEIPKADIYIMNPPWEREILHPTIEIFRNIAPTWLLFDSDWMFTVQAVPYKKFCQKIVTVGRISWMGNGTSGKDNCCWYLFGKNECQTIFI